MEGEGLVRPGALALVVGASSGIGASVARALSAEGVTVIAASRSKDRLENLVADLITDLGASAHALTLDVSDEASVSSVLERLPPALQAVDILINCAGHDVGGRQRFDVGAAADWASIIDVNVTGMIRVCHAVIPGMLARGRGHVVNIGSVAGLKTYPGGSIYAASKHAVRAFTEGLRADYADQEIRITEVLPGLTRTEFAERRWSGDRSAADQFYDNAPQVLLPEDVANSVVFALKQPPHVNLAQILIMPTREA
ncbi:MAG: SDR family oxidoreductase [Pseudomonadota bacterium]